jgi:hypothetical protein
MLTSVLVGGEWSVPHPGCFNPGERAPNTPWIGDWVDPRAGLDDVQKRKFLTLPRLEHRPLVRPAFSQSLYRLIASSKYSFLNYCSFHYSSSLRNVVKFVPDYMASQPRTLLLRLYSPRGPWQLFPFPNLYTVGRTPWTSDQPVARPLATNRKTQT